MEDQSIFYKKELENEIKMRRHLAKEVERLNRIIADQVNIILSKDSIIDEHKHVYQELDDSKQIQHNLKESIVKLQKEISDGQQREKDSKNVMEDLNKEVKLVAQ